MSASIKPMSLRAAFALLAIACAFAAGLCAARPALAADEYRIWVQGTRVTSDNAADVLGDGHVGFAVEDGTNVLTLSDATLRHAWPDRSFCTAIQTSEDLVVRLEGDSVILPECDEDIGMAYLFGVVSHADNSLVFEGPGSLTLAGGFIPGSVWQYIGIVVPNAEVTICKGATIDIDFSTHAGHDGNMTGYNGGNKLTVDGATLAFECSDTEGSTTGVIAQGIEIVNGAQVSLSLNQSAGSAAGIVSGGNLTVAGHSALTSNCIVRGYCPAIAANLNISFGEGCLVVANAYQAPVAAYGAITLEDGVAFLGASPDSPVFSPAPTGLSEDMLVYVATEPSGENSRKVSASEIADARYVRIPASPFAMRIAGDYANETAALISRVITSDSHEAVVLARDDDFADALGATGLAGALDAPILLTNRMALSPAAAERIRDLDADTVYIIGGPGAMKDQLEADLAEQCGVKRVLRVYGENSYDTSLACAHAIEAITLRPATEAIVAMSTNFQDALSMSGIAYMNRTPVILQTWGATSADRGFTDEARAYLEGKSLIVAGGPGAISEASLEGLNVADRIYGETGYDTSAAIAKWGLERGYFNTSAAIIACGAQAPKGTDALAGSMISGKLRAPILLVNANEEMEGVNTVATDTLLGEGGAYENVATVIVLGGAYVMPQEYVDSLSGIEVPLAF